jgi:hypothetical protein
MKIRTRWIFTIILCLLIAIPLAACDGSPAAPNGTLESKNGVTVEGTFADGAIAGIAVGSVAVAGVGGFSVFWFVIKKKKFADLIAIFKKK